MNTREKIILKCTPAWVVAVDMGYGHQRPAHNLGCIAFGGTVINANNYRGIPDRDRKIWNGSRRFYEWISRFKSFPVIGEMAWSFYDYLQKIEPFYPKRDLSRVNMQTRSIYYYIDRGWGKDLIEKLNKKDMPLITTFFAVAFMAEEHGFINEIYCVVTDTDISRSWVAKNPTQSRIKYFCPNKRTYDRLKLYGVKTENIFLTGFPLPLDNIGVDREIASADLLARLSNLDPKKKFFEKYADTISSILGIKNPVYHKTRPLTITFAVGGAGAQRELAITILKSLKDHLKDGNLHLYLVAGVHNSVASYFKKNISLLGLSKFLGDSIHILHAPSKKQYFEEFNALMRKTDILWTKPSELSFYCALGIPIIVAPPIGSQEDFNKVWLKTVGAGIPQDDPRYVNEWLFEWLDSGYFAEAALEGFLDAPKYGAYNIGQIISTKPEQVEHENILLQI